MERLSNQVIISGNRDCCGVFTALSITRHLAPLYSREIISTADIAKAGKLTLLQSKWITSITGSRKKKDIHLIMGRIGPLNWERLVAIPCSHAALTLPYPNMSADFNLIIKGETTWLTCTISLIQCVYFTISPGALKKKKRRRKRRKKEKENEKYLLATLPSPESTHFKQGISHHHHIPNECAEWSGYFPTSPSAVIHFSSSPPHLSCFTFTRLHTDILTVVVVGEGSFTSPIPIFSASPPN